VPLKVGDKIRIPSCGHIWKVIWISEDKLSLVVEHEHWKSCGLYNLRVRDTPRGERRFLLIGLENPDELKPLKFNLARF